MVAVPEEVVTRVLTELAQRGAFADATQAAREICAPGVVCSAWSSALTDDVWRTLYLRVSPAALRAAPDTMPTSLFENVVPAGATAEDWEVEPFPLRTETLASRAARAWMFANSITSPFVQPSAETASVDSRSFKAAFRQRLCCARLAESNYRASGRTEFRDNGELRLSVMPQFTCTAKRGDGQDKKPFDLGDLSFVFELFELDDSSRRRKEWLAEEEEDPVRADFVSAALRLRFAGPPHFAARLDLGGKTENLLWTCTVRAAENGVVHALVPLDASGKLIHKYTLPIDSGMNDYQSQWCLPWRLVVTAVRDTDAKMCQIVDVRGLKRVGDHFEGHGFKEMFGYTCCGEATFRIVEALKSPSNGDDKSDDDDDESQIDDASGGDQPLDVGLFLGNNSSSARGVGPRLVGNSESEYDRDPSDSDEAQDLSDRDEAQAAFETFKDSGASESSGALFQLTLKWTGTLPRGEYPGTLVDHGDASAAAVQSAEDAQISANLEWVAKKLATLTWV